MLRIRVFGACAMSHGKRPFTDAQLDCAIKVVHKHGYVVTGLRRHADGFTIMTSKPGDANGTVEKFPLNDFDVIRDGKDPSQTR